MRYTITELRLPTGLHALCCDGVIQRNLFGTLASWLAVANWIESPTDRALFTDTLAVGIEPLGNVVIWNRYRSDDEEVYLSPTEAAELARAIRCVCGYIDGDGI